MAKRSTTLPPAPRLTVMGLDPSLTGFGVCAIGPDIAGSEVRTVLLNDIGNQGDDLTSRYSRIHFMLTDLAGLVDEVQPALIAIEGYSFGSNQNQHSRIIELGAVVRHELLALYDCILEPTPTEVKKFATGKGNAKKDQMRLGAYKRWGFEASTSDEVDAYVMARLAQAVADPQAAGFLTMPQREVIDAVQRRANYGAAA